MNTLTRICKTIGITAMLLAILAFLLMAGIMFIAVSPIITAITLFTAILYLAWCLAAK